MSMGIKKRIILACLEYDVVRIIQPVKDYNADVLITFHDMFGVNSEIKMRCADELQKELEGSCPNTHYSNFQNDLKDFTSLSKALESYISGFNAMFNRPEIFINISAGTNEFAAAATMSSMLHDNVQIFTVKDLETNIDQELIERAVLRNGVPTGTAAKVSEPDVITVYPAEPPKKHLVLGLRIFNDRLEKGESIAAKDMVSEYIKEGIWLRDGTSPNDGVFFLRDFVDKWIENGWLQRGQLKNRYNLTDKGKMVLDTFYNFPSLEEFR